MNGDDSNGVVSTFDDDGREAAALGNHLRHLAEDRVVVAVHAEVVELALGDDEELREVDRVGAFTKDRALRAALTAHRKEAAHVLVVHVSNT